MTDPIAWLERGYDEPDAFREPNTRETHTPLGLFRTKPDHRGDCYCETGAGEIWLQADVAAKWRWGDR